MPPFIGCSAYDNLRSPAFFALMNIFPYFFLLYHLFLSLIPQHFDLTLFIST